MKLYNGDCIEVLKQLEENSVDAIVTDPPYELGFMGKSWDGTGIANDKEMWADVLRVLKPGGHLLAFSGTRTYHRMAVAIEDAGFEVRDMIEWVYGSGFPKSLNIGKAVDKLLGNEKFKVKEIEFVRWLKSNLGSLLIEDIDKLLGLKNGAFHFFAESDSNRQIPNTEHYKKIKEYLHLDDDYDEFVKKHNLLLEEIRDVQGYEKSIKNWDKKYEKAILNKPKTELSSEYEGWGTALKPAHEPICMARKPLAEKTVAENVLKYGTGGINIDESRVGTDTISIHNAPKGTFAGGEPDRGSDTESYRNSVGRFPANLIHDNSEEVRECFPETKSGAMNSIAKANQYNTYGKMYERQVINEASEGNASRFFKSIIYQAKASKSERNKGCEELEEKYQDESREIGSAGGTNPRNRGAEKPLKNFHPTVKPIALMEYLIQMVTPEGGTVLDPFMGSGSTGVAAKRLKRHFIGIEREADYIKIAEVRINAIPDTM